MRGACGQHHALPRNARPRAASARGEGAAEELLHGAATVLLEEPRAAAGEARMTDHRRRNRFPRIAGPAAPAVALLVEHEQRLVAELRELGAPAGAALHRVVGKDLADDVDLLRVVHLVPDALQHLLE